MRSANETSNISFLSCLLSDEIFLLHTLKVTACSPESWHGQREREWADLCGPDPAVSAQAAFSMA